MGLVLGVGQVLGLGFRPGGRGVPRVNVSVTCSSSAPDLARLGAGGWGLRLRLEG